MRIDLSTHQPGAWVDLREEVPFGLVKGLSNTVDSDTQQITDLDGYTVSMVNYLVRDWHVADVDGQPLPEPRTVTVGALELVKIDVLRAILDATSEILKRAQPDPNSGGVSSTS